MAFAINCAQQINFDDSFNNLSDREKRFLGKSWAKGFADNIFPAITEERFAVLYSGGMASRPNTPVNVIVGSLLLKEMFGLTDEELLESILFDVRFQYALHTTSFDEQPYSDRTPSRFRERLQCYETETGIDLLAEEMKAMAEKICQFFNITPGTKRMDSVMVSSSCKKMSRLELIYTCVANMVKAIHATGEDGILGKGLRKYLKEENHNAVIYRSKPEEIGNHLQSTIRDAVELLKVCADGYGEMEEYILLKRLVQDQTCQINGKTEAKRNTDILPSSLQNPSDPDATYRKKAGEKHVGFVGNFVETFDEDAAVITDFDYQQNTHSDSEFCKEVIENMEHQEEKTTLIADGAYASTENTQLADEKNIELVTTALTGKLPNVIQADFVIDDDAKTVTACPAGHKPFQCKYNEVTESYRMLFNKQPCEDCPHNQTCGVRFQKKTAVVTISKKTVQRAKYLRKMDSESYQQLFNKRNGVEGIPSVLRRKYGVDHIPVRGYVRSKMWFTLKIGAINVVRLLAKVALEGFTVIFHISQLIFSYFGCCHKLVQKVVAV